MGNFRLSSSSGAEYQIVKCPFRCPKCGAQADFYGDHLLRCMTGGDKGALHAEICKAAFDTASSLLLRPRTEEHPFSQWGLRCDVSIATEHVGDATHMDFACIRNRHPLCGKLLLKPEGQLRRTKLSNEPSTQSMLETYTLSPWWWTQWEHGVPRPSQSLSCFPNFGSNVMQKPRGLSTRDWQPQLCTAQLAC